MYPRSIYEITHLATGRKYVGSSTDVTKRWKKHLWELQKGIHPVEAMQRDYDRLGKEYSFAIIGQIADESEDHKEYDCMIERESNIRGRGYNYKDRKCPKKSSIELEKEVNLPPCHLHGEAHRAYAHHLQAHQGKEDGRPVQYRRIPRR